MPRIESKILQGTRDFLPSDMLLRTYVFQKIKKVVESFGFEPLETPAIEYAEILENKFGEGSKLIYRFTDQGERKLALKYDLTVPTARVVAMYSDLVKPFKRYQAQPVWRADRPQKGRYREFWQFDFDTFGSRSMLFDAEILYVIYEVLRELGFKQFRILVNNRKVLNGLVEYAGFNSAATFDVLRILDKHDKVGTSGVRSEFLHRGFSQSSVDKLLELVDQDDTGDNISRIKRLEALLTNSSVGLEGLKELEQIFSSLEAYNVDERFIQFTPPLARGLDYYTGPIHEVVVDEPKIGSLCGGGRYDELVETLGGPAISATGTSLGIERIIDVIKELKLGPQLKTLSAVLICVTEDVVMKYAMALSRDLRECGMNTEIYLDADNLSTQLKYANRKGIPFAVIMPKSSEIASGIFVVRDMVNHKQYEVQQSEVANVLKDKLADL